VCALAASAYSAEAAGGPVIERFAVSHVTETSARLGAAIDPGGAATKWSFWVYYQPCQHGAGECAEKPRTERVGGGELAAGDAGVLVRRVVGKLRHGCEYTFWATARNASGESTSSRDTVTTAGGEGLACRR
jgi:hypothetical protein